MEKNGTIRLVLHASEICSFAGSVSTETGHEGKIRLIESAVSADLQDYSDHVNPQWVRLLDLLQMNAQYTRCEGVELTTPKAA